MCTTSPRTSNTQLVKIVVDHHHQRHVYNDQHFDKILILRLLIMHGYSAPHVTTQAHT